MYLSTVFLLVALPFIACVAQHDAKQTKMSNRTPWTSTECERRDQNNGGYYCGQFSNDDRAGLGMRFYPDGNTYLGDYVADKSNGIGYWIYNNKDDDHLGRYMGGVIDHRKNGYGYSVWANGDSYMGGWKNDKKHGWGIYYYGSNGQHFAGNYVDGVKISGTWYEKDGKIIFQGLFKNEKPVYKNGK